MPAIIYASKESIYTNIGKNQDAGKIWTKKTGEKSTSLDKAVYISEEILVNSLKEHKLNLKKIDFIDFETGDRFFNELKEKTKTLENKVIKEKPARIFALKKSSESEGKYRIICSSKIKYIKEEALKIEEDEFKIGEDENESKIGEDEDEFKIE